ncbi:hypothetical protein RDABS01_018097 [Bienertia sinuspersici]
MFLVCEHLKLGYLSPYLDSLSLKFTSGVNFFVSGALLLPKFVPMSKSDTSFVTETSHLSSSLGSKDLISEEGFRNVVYMIDIEQNDLLMALYASNLTYEPVAHQISSTVYVLRLAYKDAVIVYVDVYFIKYSLFANPERYGFKNLFAACCGRGVPHYYDRNATCG